MNTLSKKTVTAVLAACALALVLAGNAFATFNTWYDLPDYYGDGDAIVYRIYDPSGLNSYAVDGQVRWNRYAGSYCTYVQYKPTAVLALDGDWKRLTPGDNCSSSYSYYSFHREAFLAYDGIKFRICQDRPWQSDSCGSSSSNIRWN
jgi:hypothetical protein